MSSGPRMTRRVDLDDATRVEVHYDEPHWVSPSTGERFSYPRQALRVELWVHYRARGAHLNADAPAEIERHLARLYDPDYPRR